MGGRGSSSGLKGVQQFVSGEGGRIGTSKEIDISKIKDTSLQGIEDRIRNLKHEELYVFDENDNLVAGYKGNANSVAFPASILDMEGATITHGHPKSMEDFGGTFSFADMNNMLNSNWAEHRATASGQGEMNYILRRTSKSDAAGFRRRLNADQSWLETSIASTYNTAYKTAIDNGQSKKNAMHTARQRAVGELNSYYKQTAPQYGFEYINRKKNYTYNR